MQASGATMRDFQDDRSGAVAAVRNDRDAAAERIAQGLRRSPVSPLTLATVARGVDFATTALGLWFAAYATTAPSTFVPGFAALGACLTALVCVGALGLGGDHGLRALARLWRGWARVVAAGVVGAGAGLLAGIWTAPPAPFLAAAAAGVALLGLPGRAVVRMCATWVRDFGLSERRALIVGGGENAAELMRALTASPENDIRVCGIFDDRDDLRSPPVVMGVPKIGSVRSLVEFVRRAEIDMVIVTLPLSAERRIRELLSLVKVLPLDVRLSAYSADYAFPRRRASGAAEGGLIDVMRRPLAGSGRIRKRAFDLVLAGVALLLLAPVMLAVALAIRLESRGPVIFRQMRHGYNHRSVEVWKFRSMYHESTDATARRVVTREDPRVTRVGRFIRKTSLDELPQLVNVLRGDLSLVGPRPHVLAAVSSRQQAFEEIVEGYAARHKVPPGVTGWAQIHGWRGEIDDPEKLQKRFEHDLYYIENWSIWLDFYVLAMTPLRLLDTRNAY